MPKLLRTRRKRLLRSVSVRLKRVRVGKERHRPERFCSPLNPAA